MRTSSALVAIAAFAFLILAPGLAEASGRRYSVNTSLNFTDRLITADDLERYFEAQGMRGMRGTGAAFVAAGQRYGINPVYIMAHAGWESAWGSSRIARDKKNLFGYGAYDRCPYNCAKSFASYEEGVAFVMAKVQEDYLRSDGRFYGGAPTLKGMNRSYATDKNWSNGITGIMNEFEAWYDKNGSARDVRGSNPAADSAISFGGSGSNSGNGLQLNSSGLSANLGNGSLNLGFGNGGSLASGGLGNFGSSGILPGDQPLGGLGGNGGLGNGGFGGNGSGPGLSFDLGNGMSINLNLGTQMPAGPWDSNGTVGAITQLLASLLGMGGDGAGDLGKVIGQLSQLAGLGDSLQGLSKVQATPNTGSR